MFSFKFPDTAKYEAWNKELRGHLNWKRRNDFLQVAKIFLPVLFDVIDKIIDKSKNRKNE